MIGRKRGRMVSNTWGEGRGLLCWLCTLSSRLIRQPRGTPALPCARGHRGVARSIGGARRGQVDLRSRLVRAAGRPTVTCLPWRCVCYMPNSSGCSLASSLPAPWRAWPHHPRHARDGGWSHVPLRPRQPYCGSGVHWACSSRLPPGRRSGTGP